MHGCSLFVLERFVLEHFVLESWILFALWLHIVQRNGCCLRQNFVNFIWGEITRLGRSFLRLSGRLARPIRPATFHADLTTRRLQRRPQPMLAFWASVEWHRRLVTNQRNTGVRLPIDVGVNDKARLAQPRP